MQVAVASKRNRKSHHPRRPRLSPYLLDEVAFTRSDIERARTDAVPAA
jgi:hypothetical protein